MIKLILSNTEGFIKWPVKFGTHSFMNEQVLIITNPMIQLIMK